MSAITSVLAEPAKRNVLVLAVCTAFGHTGISMTMVIAALVGQMLAVDKSLATLPLAFQFTAMMATTIPASLFMQWAGRRAGFSLGAVLGAIGGAIGATAIYTGDFWLLIVAHIFVGSFLSFVQYYRFAAADVAGEAFRPRAISLVMAGGVVAAVAGPELAKWSKDAFPPFIFAGCYMLLSVLACTTLLVMQFVRIPRPVTRSLGGGRPLSHIFTQPAVFVAVLSGAVGYGSMVLVMTATPLAMVACGFAFVDAAFVIQWHALAMFAPSFFTGSLIKRVGVLPVILLGGVMNLICVIVNSSGIEFGNFWVGLVLLGLGWNFMFIGATTLLTDCHAPEERGKVQAANDFIVFGTVALASFSSGALQHWIGWTAVNLTMVPAILAAVAGVFWLMRQQVVSRA